MADKGENLRVLSWNVNGWRSVVQKLVNDPFFNPTGLKGPRAFGAVLKRFFKHHGADVICLQETKCTKMSQLEDSIIHVEGYESFWSFSTVKSGYSGVATYVKKGKTLEASITPFEDTRLNHEGRTVMTDHKNFVLFNCYFPNAGQGDERLAYKMKFCDALAKLCDELKAKGREVIIVGDFNIAHNEIDNSYAGKEERACFIRCERDWFTKLLESGYVDTYRYFYPEKVAYTWWDPKNFRRTGNEGVRIDYCVVSSGLLPSVKDALIIKDQHGSDHCPCGVDLHQLEPFETTTVHSLSSDKRKMSLQSFFKPKQRTAEITIETTISTQSSSETEATTTTSSNTTAESKKRNSEIAEIEKSNGNKSAARNSFAKKARR